MSLLVFTLLVVVERRNVLIAAAYSIGADAVRLLAVRQGAEGAARTRRVLVLTPWKPSSTACCSASRSRCGRTCCGTRSSAAWSARWSACCPASARSPASRILLPLTFGLDATKAIVMLAGIYYGSQYGGSTTSILLRIPGEAASVMTCIDGNAMAQEGPRRRGALHRRGRLVHRRHLRRHRAHAGGAAARRLRAALRPAGIHRAAGARPDLPRLHVDDARWSARC